LKKKNVGYLVNSNAVPGLTLYGIYTLNVLSSEIEMRRLASHGQNSDAVTGPR